MAGKLTEAVYLETMRERKLRDEREAYEREHPKPWYLINRPKNDNAKRNRNTDDA